MHCQAALARIQPLLFPPLPLFFFTAPAPTEIYTLSLHDALPISIPIGGRSGATGSCRSPISRAAIAHITHSQASSRSEEHTSELQSRFDLVCRLLLEKKKVHENDLVRHSNLVRGGGSRYRRDTEL